MGAFITVIKWGLVAVVLVALAYVETRAISSVESSDKIGRHVYEYVPDH
jgi:hypothetical protein